jgi:hypothetical protein
MRSGQRNSKTKLSSREAIRLQSLRSDGFRDSQTGDWTTLTVAKSASMRVGNGSRQPGNLIK